MDRADNLASPEVPSPEGNLGQPNYRHGAQQIRTQPLPESIESPPATSGHAVPEVAAQQPATSGNAAIQDLYNSLAILTQAVTALTLHSTKAEVPAAPPTPPAPAPRWKPTLKKFTGAEHETPEEFADLATDHLRNMNIETKYWTAYLLEHGLEGEAATWATTHADPKLEYHTFFGRLIDHFSHPSRFSRLLAKLYGYKQRAEPAAEFISKKMALFNRVSPFTRDEDRCTIIMDQLRPEIRQFLRSNPPKTEEDLRRTVDEIEIDIEASTPTSAKKHEKQVSSSGSRPQQQERQPPPPPPRHDRPRHPTADDKIDIIGPITENFLIDEVFAGPSGPVLELVTENQHEDQKGAPPDDYSLVQIGIPENEPTDNNPKGILDMSEMNTFPNVQISAESTNSTTMGDFQAGGSECIKSKTGRKRKFKSDKMYIDYLSDDDFATFVDCGESSNSEEWSGVTFSSDDEVSPNTRKTKKTKSKCKPKVCNNSFTDIHEDTVAEKGFRMKKKNSRKELSQKRASGQQYERKDGKIIEPKSVQPNPCIGKRCGNNCENIDTEKRQKVFDHFVGLCANRRRDWLVSVAQKRIYVGKHLPPNKTKPATIQSVYNFIKSLPAVPSHYCRHDSTRVYLSHEHKNITNLYRTYKKQSEENGTDFVSERVYRRIFTEEFNIGFHIPKKDKCLKCLKFEQENISDPIKAKEKSDHEVEKNESYNRFSTHKNIHKTDPNTLCVSFDLEKVLNTPHVIQCSYIIHENWQCIIYAIMKTEREKFFVITGMKVTAKGVRTRYPPFSIGHTYMPVDSVHAVIEANLKNTIIYTPSQWYTVFSTARKDPFPYNVEKLTFEDFYKWDSMSDKYFKGNLTGKISKIRIVTFKKSDPLNVTVKYSMNKSAQSSKVELQSRTKVPLMACYQSRLPITKAKYNDLIKLCKEKVIPGHFQNEFTDLPYSENIKDTLPESDIEDVEPDDAQNLL
ncbi:unnamed protein product [Diabrotica balteata]|uniref:Uncharacterized protein n=1 Tax=Diabrotica balteata TaxID=107213 RepID=A0A9P0DVS4_DIABA|nr:unnamed protein product [Diabrotica balteata]